VLFTPAYWAVQVKHWGTDPQPGTHRLASNFREEALACMLGGHGIPSDVALAVFRRLRSTDYVRLSFEGVNAVIDLLSEPVETVNGRRVRYRFARAKGTYIYELLTSWQDPPPHYHSRDLRDWLLQFNGIGPKTASWIVRNWLDSDEVAILDIHIFRAGVLAGLFNPSDRIDRDYLRLEERFLQFAGAIGARPSILDAIIWSQMKQAGHLVNKAISSYHDPSTNRRASNSKGRRRCLEAVAATAAAARTRRTATRC
jgi:hypothetical protein